MTSRLWLLVGLIAVGSCKPGPGSSCDPRESRCLDATRAIVCDDGKFVETPCRGKAGCFTLREQTTCDFSGNQPGDPCGKSDEGVAVCLGDDGLLACRGRKFARVPCRGPGGCHMVGGQPHCDQSVADRGETCSKHDAKACSVDQTQVLSCRDGRMTGQYFCRGEGRCRSTGGKLTCDQTVAKLGDACDQALSGHIACSEDKKSLITCQNQRFIPSEKCRPGTLCTVLGQSTRCEKP